MDCVDGMHSYLPPGNYLESFTLLSCYTISLNYVRMLEVYTPTYVPLAAKFKQLTDTFSQQMEKIAML